MEPEEILDNVREAIREHSGGDADRWFYANRFVFARLQLDERRTKTQIKAELMKSGVACHYCGQAIGDRSGVHLHRIDGERGYSAGNCALMHAECHGKYHSENPRGARPGRPRGGKAAVSANPILKKVSKRYDDKGFIYWWDISPGFIDKMEKYEAVEFVKKDSGERCHVPTPALRGYLTKQRQTSRGTGNWGIKVLKEREAELAFEPGGKESEWLFLPVVWEASRGED